MKQLWKIIKQKEMETQKDDIKKMAKSRRKVEGKIKSERER